MRRREFIALIGTIGACPCSLIAQPARHSQKTVPRVGFLASTPQGLIELCAQGLREQGYVEGENIIIERRIWRFDPEQLKKLVAELVALDVEVIVAPSTPEAVAARAATDKIPIVTATGDAVGVGLAASLARPGGNVTGLTVVAGPMDYNKHLDLLTQLLPGSSRFAVLLDPSNRFHAQAMVGIRAAAAERRLEVMPAVRHSLDDIGPAFQAMAANGVQGLVALSDPIEFSHRGKIIELAAQHRIPTAYRYRESAVDGGLLAYGPNIREHFRRTATYVAKLLRGAKAAELPIEQAERFLLTINLQTAKTLGLTVPTALLATADEVIE